MVGISNLDTTFTLFGGRFRGEGHLVHRSHVYQMITDVGMSHGIERVMPAKLRNYERYATERSIGMDLKIILDALKAITR